MTIAQNISSTVPQTTQPTACSVSGYHKGAYQVLDVVPRDNGTTTVDGYQANNTSQLLIAPRPDGAVKVSGTLGGYPCQINVVRASNGTIGVTGTQLGRDITLTLTSNADETVTVVGHQHGNAANYTVGPVANGQAKLDGVQGGSPVHLLMRQSSLFVNVFGIAGSNRTDMSMMPKDATHDMTLERVGDFLPGFSTAERLALTYGLIIA